jgi:S-adenosylmethionine/arginine decarboxylase-like enzyme
MSGMGKNQKSVTGRPYFIHFLIGVKLEGGFFESVGQVGELAGEMGDRLGLKAVKKDGYKYQPRGVTYVVILSQSHLVIHTWPEYNFIHIDLLSCTKISRKNVEKKLRAIFEKRFRVVNFDITEQV